MAEHATTSTNGTGVGHCLRDGVCVSVRQTGPLTLLQPIPAERELALGSLRPALAGLLDPADGSPGWPRHRQGRRSSPEQRAAPRTRTGASQLSISRHGMSAAESPVPVRRHVMPLRPTARFGESNGPSKGQRAVPLPVRLARRYFLRWSAGQTSNARRVNMRVGTRVRVM